MIISNAETRFRERLAGTGSLTAASSLLAECSEALGWERAAFNADMEQIEWGIEPDIKVNMDEADETKHIDTIIEKARAFLKGEWTPE